MTNFSLANQRLNNQRISKTKFTQPQEVVKWLGAVQAQDYMAAKWAVAQRARDLTDAAMDQAFADGKILRTHILRPTWHFVSPDDIRWMLMLTASHVHATNAYYYRRSGLDKAIFKHCHTAIAKALRGGKQLTRAELGSALQKTGVETGGELRLNLIVMHAELDGLICSGARRGKQFTYALLEERVPPADTLEHDEALAELTRRYFTSHGPATLKDFAWWSGLSMAEAGRGLEMIRSEFGHRVIDEQDYWYTLSASDKKAAAPTAYLLPNFDEFTVGYTDRSAIHDAPPNIKPDARGNSLLQNIILLDGQVAGTWRRTLRKNEVIVVLKPYAKLKKIGQQAVDHAARRYGGFLGLPAAITHIP